MTRLQIGMGMAVVFLLAACQSQPAVVGQASPGDERSLPRTLGKDVATASFRLINGTLTCDVVAAPSVGKERIVAWGEQPCLRIGPIEIGAPGDEVMKTLGNVVGSTMSPAVSGKLPVSYPVPQFQPEFPKFTGTWPFFVVTYRDGRAVTVQLSGPKTRPGALTFSGLNLGDSAQRVREVLGPPTEVKPAPRMGGDEWFYPPHQFTLILRNDVLASIRVYAPGEY